MDERSNTATNIQCTTSSDSIGKSISNSWCKYDQTKNKNKKNDKERNEFHRGYSQDEPAKRSLTDSIARIS